MAETWKTLPSDTRYAVSDRGRVRGVFGRIVAGGLGGALGNQYRYVWIGGKRKRKVASVVAECFIGPRPTGMVIRHVDGERLNDASENLAYGTHKENSADMHTHGTILTGIRNPRAKLTDEQVSEIRSIEYETQALIASRFGISRSYVSQLRAGVYR